MATSTLIPLPKAPEAPALARRAIDQLSGLRENAAISARLLVSELVTNAIRHVPDRGQIGMMLEVDRGALHVEVQDPGAGFTPRPRDESSPLGGSWGLHLVGELADRWGVDGGRPTCVWFEIDDALPG